MDYLISDTHFGHWKIIEYCDRPFIDVNIMDETLIKNWNSVVKKGDRIYHLGDVSMRNTDGTKNVISRLNGEKILIMGNHDKRSRSWFMNVGFNEVYRHDIILHKKYILSHSPYLSDFGDMINIHGHVHNRTLENKVKYFNVSVENINYIPIALDKVRNQFEG